MAPLRIAPLRRRFSAADRASLPEKSTTVFECLERLPTDRWPKGQWASQLCLWPLKASFFVCAETPESRRPKFAHKISDAVRERTIYRSCRLRWRRRRPGSGSFGGPSRRGRRGDLSLNATLKNERGPHTHAPHQHD